MHGVTLTLEADYAPLMAYAAEHLGGMVGPPHANPDLVVKCVWSRDEWDPQFNPFAGNGRLNVIGKRMLGNNDELIWLNTVRKKGLQLRFRREQNQYLFEVAYSFHPKQDKLKDLPEYEYKSYFSLMSYLVYYPLMWHLETFHGWTPLHASALATSRGGIIIGGLGGVGKTTTCVGLMQRKDIELIAENIIFTNGKLINPCSEPIRLDERSLGMLGNRREGLVPMFFPEGLKEKWLFNIKSDAIRENVIPTVLFLPTFSSQRYLTPIPPDIAAEKLVAINRLTLELDDYAWYAAALDMTWPRPGLAERRIQVLQKLTERIRCFELGVDRSAGVDAVVEDILKATFAC